MTTRHGSSEHSELVQATGTAQNGPPWQPYIANSSPPKRHRPASDGQVSQVQLHYPDFEDAFVSQTEIDPDEDMDLDDDESRAIWMMMINCNPDEAMDLDHGHGAVILANRQFADHGGADTAVG